VIPRCSGSCWTGCGSPGLVRDGRGPARTAWPGTRRTRPRAHRRLLRDRGIKAVIPEPGDQVGHRARRGSRGGRPPGFDPVAYRGRNVIERCFNQLKQWRGLATRYDKHARTYRAAVHLAAVLLWLRPLGDTA